TEPDAVVRRLDHFLLENETLVPAAAKALAKGDVAGFGRAADESQRAADELLGNQVPETIALARDARRLGASAASAFGAGFGDAVESPTGDLMPVRSRTLFIATLVAAVGLCLLAPRAEAAGTTPVMLLDGESGGPWHRWQITTPALKKALEDSGLFTVDVVT